MLSSNVLQIANYYQTLKANFIIEQFGAEGKMLKKLSVIYEIMS